MSEAIQVVTLQDALDYLGIDYADSMVNSNIERSIATADAYLRGSLGEDYPVGDPRAKELALMIIADLYDNRGISTNVSSKMRRLVDDLSWQIRLELRRGSGE